MTGASLFTEQWGSGPPVAFVHGLGASARYWQRVRDVSTGYRGVAPDLLGFGRSPAPPAAVYDVDTHLEALAPVVPAGSIVVGHSTRPLVIAVAPLVIRDLPPSIASDAAHHTWPSYHRTLERVVVAYRPRDDLATAPAPVTFLHGTDDRTAPPEHVRRLVDDLTADRKDVDLRLVPGDHHLAVRRPEQVAKVLPELIAASEATP